MVLGFWDKTGHLPSHDSLLSLKYLVFLLSMFGETESEHCFGREGD